MLRYLRLPPEYQFLDTIGTALYYPLAVAAGLFVVYKLYTRLLSSGYDENKLAKFFLVYVIIAIPGAYLGSRAAGMFYEPPSEWSVDLLLENVSSGRTHTFHASIILPLIILSVSSPIMKFRYVEVMDTVFLYVPVAHSIGRVACLIIGCCWGRSVVLDSLGLHTRIPNPVPLYEIGLNLCIFYFLKQLYDRTYVNQATGRRYEGSIVASYLVSYGVVRIILEVFRKERRIGFELTQAQIVMVLFMLVGVVIFLAILYRNRGSLSPQSVDSEADADVEDQVKRLFSLLGGVVSYLALLFVMYHLAKRLRSVEWPIAKADSISDAYGKVIAYFPALLLPLVSVFWLRRVGLPALQKFRWKRFPAVFYVVLIVSLLPAIQLFMFGEWKLRGFEYLPPFLILCAMNAFCEETVHRVAILGLFSAAGYSISASIAMQALLYSVVHFLVISGEMGVLSFFYGCLLGVVMYRTDSVTPCIVCHFIADVGVLGSFLSS